MMLNNKQVFIIESSAAERSFVSHSFFVKAHFVQIRVPKYISNNLRGLQMTPDTIRKRDSVYFGGTFKMTDRVCCGFVRVFLWETKATALKNITRDYDETPSHFKKRLLEERFRLYIEQFQDYKPLLMDKGKYKYHFMVCTAKRSNLFRI